MALKMYMQLCIKSTKYRNYHVHDKILYHLGKLCISQDERVNIIREAHTSLIAGHFVVGTTVAVMNKYI